MSRLNSREVSKKKSCESATSWLQLVCTSIFGLEKHTHMGCAASSAAPPQATSATLVEEDKGGTESVATVEAIPEVPPCQPFCVESVASFTLLWRPPYPDQPNKMEQVCGREKFVVYHPENMLCAPNTADAADWLGPDECKAISAALMQYARSTVKCSTSDVTEVNKALSFNVAKGSEVKEAFGGTFVWTELRGGGMFDTGTLASEYKAPSEPQPEAKQVCIETMARAKALDSMSAISAENALLTAKKALRKALPCGRVDLDELWKTTKVEGDRFSQTRTYTESWKTVAPLYRGQKGGGVAATADFTSWAGVRCLVRPGSARTHDTVVATCTKETPDAKFGVSLDGLSAVAEPKSAGPGMMKPVASEAKAKMPTIVTCGPVLEKSGLVPGDELLWINDTECTGSIKQACTCCQYPLLASLGVPLSGLPQAPSRGGLHLPPTLASLPVLASTCTYFMLH